MLKPSRDSSRQGNATDSADQAAQIGAAPELADGRSGEQREPRQTMQQGRSIEHIADRQRDDDTVADFGSGRRRYPYPKWR